MAMGIATILASPPMGVLADRYGRRRLLLTSNFIMSVSIALFSVTRDPHLLVIVAVIMGICEAGCSTSSVALLAAKSGGTHRIPAFALLGFVSGTAFSLGGFTVPLVLIFEGIGFSSRDAHIALYVIMAVLSILSVLPVLKISETEGEGTGRPSAILSPRSRRIVFRFSLAGFIVALGTGVVIPLMTRWLFLMYGVPDTISGPALGIPGLLTTAGILAAPAIAKRGGIVRAIVLLQGFSGLLLVLMPFSPGFVLAVSPLHRPDPVHGHRRIAPAVVHHGKCPAGGTGRGGRGDIGHLEDPKHGEHRHWGRADGGRFHGYPLLPRIAPLWRLDHRILAVLQAGADPGRTGPGIGLPNLKQALQPLIALQG